MKNRTYILIVAIAAAATVGCQDVYENKDLSANELIPTIEAAIYNDTTNKFVTLNYAKSLYASKTEAIIGAEVQVCDAAGNGHLFTATGNPGQYQNNDASFVPESGEQYTLKITTSDGEVLTSEPQTMPNTFTISEISINEFSTRTIESKENGETVFNTESGMGVYARVSYDGQSKLYCRFRGDFVLYTVSTPTIDPTDYFELNNPDDPTDTTWFQIITHPRYDIYTATQQTDFPKLIEFKTGVSYSNDEQNFQCCFFDKSMPDNFQSWIVFCDVISMNTATFDYYQSAYDQLNEPFRIYDPVPSQLPGNMYNESDASKPVLGLFEVSSKSTRVIEIKYNKSFGYFYFNDITGQLNPVTGQPYSRSSHTYLSRTYDTIQINNLPVPDTTIVDSMEISSLHRSIIRNNR